MAAPSLSRTVLAAVATVAALWPGVLPAHAATGRIEPGTGTWPLRPRPEVVRGFEAPTSAWGAGHRGVDLLGHVGQRVHAAAPGRVSFVGTIAGRGVVVVDHGGTRTTYEPVRATTAVGQPVSSGAPIGRLQLFGSHCFPRACLHWGLLEGERYLNPLTLVGAGPVRLLPLDGTLQGAPPGPLLWGLPKASSFPRATAAFSTAPIRSSRSGFGSAALFRAR